MNKKTSKPLSLHKRVFESIILAGVIIFGIGIYYVVVKAGIPYQDPPLELQIEYIVYEKIATELAAIGIQILILGGLLRGVVWLAEKRSRRHAKKD